MAAESGTYLLVHPAFTLEAFQGVALSMMLRLAEPGTGERGVDYCEMRVLYGIATCPTPGRSS